MSRTATKRNSHELEFLPAALEIQESPPSPTGRAISLSIVALFTVTVVWACVGEIDIVAVAQGKIVPSDRTKVVQPLEIGTVRSIRVKEGQVVSKGDVLVELDSTTTEADEKRIEHEILLARMEKARAGALVAAIDAENESATVDAEWPDGDQASDVLITQQQLLQGQWKEYRSRLRAMTNDQRRRTAELAGTGEILKKLENTLPLVTERAESMRSLSEKKLVSRSNYLELEQQRIEQAQDLAAQKKKKMELEAAIAQIDEERKAERNMTGLQQELVKARQRNHLQQLTAPVDGVVQQLAVHTIGGVVTPAQQLMVIVPNGEGIEVEAVFRNKDIGFVREGQQAEVKVDAFPYTKYGVINAELLNVSNDAVPDENLGLIYTARVLLKKSAIRVEEKLINLSPGMAERRLIEYIFSPLMQYVSESVRER